MEAICGSSRWRGPPLHGSAVLIIKGGFLPLAGQVIGIPAPPGMVAVLPKYKACGRGPWRLSWGRLCRIIGEYTPEGVDEAARSLRLSWDPRYGAFMPYVQLYDTTCIVDPRDAVSIAMRRAPRGLVNALTSVASKLEGSGGEVGVTGSLAIGSAHEGSDVDIVVVADERVVEEVVEVFSGVGSGELRELNYTGSLEARAEVWWRRRKVGGVRVTLTAVPEPPSSHCPPLISYEALKPVLGEWSGIVTVHPGQPSALLYPPCALSEEGVAVVSYEYNLAYELYKGGVFRVAGAFNGDALFLALRERRSKLERLGVFKA